MKGIDPEIAPLVDALGRIPFVETFSSCGGHPEEAAMGEYGYAVANVIFEIEDEAENLFRWMQEILRRRKAARLKREHAFIFAKNYLLNADGYLAWQWELKIQATGKAPRECRAGLDDGIAFLRRFFDAVGEQAP